jgi:hypothetical protein
MSERSSRNFILITLAVLAIWMALSHHGKSRAPKVSNGLISLITYPESKPQHHVFGDLAEFVDIFHIDLTGPGKTEELSGGAVQPNFFQKIGVEPVLGRTFKSGERWSDHVVILSYRLWQHRFHGATGVVGRKIALEDEPYQVIGVLPRDFSWNNREADVWVPCNARLDGEIGGFMTQRDERSFEPEI